ncbi:MAG TPA: ABC transporter substrate-binding protein [Casimicrobiaceae bacterium]|nr:ABC transporter substrate-binding protein [Casimicrobiaceae bacterium]
MHVVTRAIALLALTVVALLAATAQAQPRTKVTLTMGGDGLQFITQHIAMRGGFFAQEGLDAQTLDVGSGPRQVAALMGGSSEFSLLGMIQIVKANAEGANLVGVSTAFDILDIQIVLSNDAIKKTGISESMSIDEKVKRMQGLRFGITSPGSTTDTFVRTLFRARGLDPDKVATIQPMGGGSNMLAALEKGATDGFAWGAPQSQIAAVKNVGRIVINPFTGEVPEVRNVPYLVLVTSRQTLEQKPEIIRAAVRAMTRAMKFAHDNPDGARALVRQQFPDIDEAVFNRAWTDYRKGIPASPVISQEQLQNTTNWLNITAKTPLKPKYEAVISSDFAQKAAADILGK